MVEHRTGIAEVMGSNPIVAPEFFSGRGSLSLVFFISYFITVRIAFTFMCSVCLFVCLFVCFRMFVCSYGRGKLWSVAIFTNQVLVGVHVKERAREFPALSCFIPGFHPICFWPQGGGGPWLSGCLQVYQFSRYSW